MNRTQTQRNVVSGAVKALFEEAKVPMRVHLAAVNALRKAVSDQAANHAKEQMALEKVFTKLDTYKVDRAAFDGLLARYGAEVERLKKITHLKGDRGEPGEPGVGSPGKPGTSPALDEIVRAVLTQVPKSKEVTQTKPTEMSTLVQEVIKELQKGDKLHISHVKGAGAFIKDGISYRFEELMHGGSTSSSGVSVIAITGTIDDSNVTFTAASQPTLLNINGGFYQKTGGSITWSYAAGTITLSSAVGTGGTIYGLK